MKTITIDQLNTILENHKKWLNNDGGKKADLRGVDLREANLIGADLREANLSEANLTEVDLRYADLTGANLSEADLTGAILSEADLNYTNLTQAKLSNTDLNNVIYDETTVFLSLQCPEEGSFIGYKKANDKIVKLLITEDSLRSSATTRKCRCSKAKVLSITNIENTEEFEMVQSDYDKNFIYKVGEIVEVENFDINRWNECSSGIHFFITREEAVNY